eukprot:Skav204914  [mRNA]  locus=scaffold1506:38662:40158:- [translate_table: standard]
MIAQSVVHLVLPLFLHSLHKAFLTPTFLSALQVCVWLFCYLSHWVVGKEKIELTPGRIKAFCYSIHLFVLSIVMLTPFVAPDLLTFASSQPFLATSRMCLLGFVDRSVTIPFHFLFAAVDAGTYLVFFQVRSWGWIRFILLSEAAFVAANAYCSWVLELWVRASIEASLKNADAESLILSFRRMLRGVCDGEVLLDDQFKIHGESKCVQNLIMTSVSMEGKSFDSLLIDEEQQRFKAFVEPSTTTSSSEPANFWPPVCLRMSFRGSAGIRVAADIYHVPVPGLYGSKEPFHLLAFKEDSEPRAPPDAQDDAIPQLSTKKPQRLPLQSGGSASMASISLPSCELQLPGAPELRDVHFLVDVNTQQQDVLKAYLRFRRTNDADPGSGSMPTLQKIVMRQQWPQLKDQVLQFADRAFWNPNLPPQDLKRALTIQFPDSRHLLSQRVSLKSVRGEESGGQVWLCLGSLSAVSTGRMGSPSGRMGEKEVRKVQIALAVQKDMT